MPKPWTKVQCPHCDAVDSLEFVQFDPWLVAEATCTRCGKTVHIEKEAILQDYLPRHRRH